MATILVIDDESQNIRLLQRYLAETGHTLLTANNGADGWALLAQHGDAINVILLDRMMPVMDGMEFMALLKQEERFSFIPVIMQTAAADQTQVIEGIRVGVFYYLTKPYDEEVLLTVIDAALQDAATVNALREELQRYKHVLGLFEHCQVSLRTLEEARSLASFLANFFPDPGRMVLGISELLINAVEHGTLGITYEEKTALNKRGTWEAEVRRRLALPEHAAKRVRVQYEKSASAIRLTISDEGAGFDWQRYLEIDPARASDSHGRGIAMARVISFDQLTYAGVGNQVTAVVRC